MVQHFDIVIWCIIRNILWLLSVAQCRQEHTYLHHCYYVYPKQQHSDSSSVSLVTSTTSKAMTVGVHMSIDHIPAKLAFFLSLLP